jgi:hypothetical protein
MNWYHRNRMAFTTVYSYTCFHSWVTTMCGLACHHSENLAASHLCWKMVTVLQKTRKPAHHNSTIIQGFKKSTKFVISKYVNSDTKKKTWKHKTILKSSCTVYKRLSPPCASLSTPRRHMRQWMYRSCILNLGTRWRWVVSFRSLPP